jgi:adenylate cyclase
MIRLHFEEGSLAGFSDFVAELKRRRVIRALLGWGIASFAVLQVYEPVMHGLHLPEWTLSFVVIALGLGFPVTTALAWVFDIKASGIERTPPDATRDQASSMSQGSRRARRALLLLGLGFAAATPGLVYFFVWPGADRGPARGSAAPSTAAGPSIAVLAFANMSADKDQEYFADGVTEEILNSLARVEGLRVVGRTSSFYFKGRNEDLASIARKLAVGAVLEGSVRKDGNRVRVTAQLLDAADGSRLWSETYERELRRMSLVRWRQRCNSDCCPARPWRRERPVPPAPRPTTWSCELAWSSRRSARMVSSGPSSCSRKRPRWIQPMRPPTPTWPSRFAC